MTFIDPHVVNYDSHPVDFKREHITFGSGQGRDLIIQDGKGYTSWGKQISLTREDIQSHQIQWSRELEHYLAKRELQAKLESERARIEQAIYEIEVEEKRRILSDLPPTFADKSDVGDDFETADALDDLEKEFGSAPLKKRRA